MPLSFTIPKMEMNRERLWHKMWLGEALVVMLLSGKQSCKWLTHILHAVLSPQHVTVHLLLPPHPTPPPADGIFKGSRAKRAQNTDTSVQRYATDLVTGEHRWLCSCKYFPVGTVNSKIIQGWTIWVHYQEFKWLFKKLMFPEWKL